MALPTLEKDISYISKLADQPNDTTGSNLSAAELKSRFDAAGEDIKAYLNSILLPALEDAIAAAAEGVAGDAQIGADKISDNAITSSKLAAAAVATNAIANLAVTAAKIADKAVTEAKLADGAVSTGKIANAAVTKEKIADGAVNSAQIYNGAVSTEKLKDAAVATSKLADNAVIPSKLDRKYASLDENGMASAKYTYARIKGITSPTYTLAAEDAGLFVPATVSSTVTIPEDADCTMFPIGTEIEIYKAVAENTLTLQLASVAGVFKTTDGEKFTVEAGGDYAVIVLKRLDALDWLAKGDIA